MIVWTDSFATKIDIVDSQHKKLFELLNQLSDKFTITSTPDRAVVDSILKELVAYADQHFIDEELLMLHGHVDARHVNVHRMEHRSFMYDVQTMYEHLVTEEDLQEVAEKLMRFVTSWLTYHILGTDQIMAAQIAAIQHGITPTQAYELRHTVKYDTVTTHLMLDSVLDLWRMSMERCHKLEAKLAELGASS